MNNHNSASFQCTGRTGNLLVRVVLGGPFCFAFLHRGTHWGGWGGRWGWWGGWGCRGRRLRRDGGRWMICDAYQSPKWWKLQSWSRLYNRMKFGCLAFCSLSAGRKPSLQLWSHQEGLAQTKLMCIFVTDVAEPCPVGQCPDGCLQFQGLLQRAA